MRVDLIMKHVLVVGARVAGKAITQKNGRTEPAVEVAHPLLAAKDDGKLLIAESAAETDDSPVVVDSNPAEHDPSTETHRCHCHA